MSAESNESINNGNSNENVTQLQIKPVAMDDVEMSTTEKKVEISDSAQDIITERPDNETKNTNVNVTQSEFAETSLKEEIFNCDRCDQVLSSLDNLNNHKKTIGYLGKELRYCDKEDCEFKSCNLVGVNTHKSQMHPVDESVIFKCDKCDYEPKGRGAERDIERHKLSDGYLKNSKSPCAICELTFCALRGLQGHIRNVHGNKFDCNKCGAALGSYGKLKYHKSQKYLCNPGLMKYLNN